jgi:hypothetical protein
MFDRVSQAAERLVTNVSRRAFLGRLGQGALVVAGVLGGVLALPKEARAGNKSVICGFMSLCDAPDQKCALVSITNGSVCVWNCKNLGTLTSVCWTI